MVSKREVRALLDRGFDYDAIGKRLGIPAGQAHLIATGVPADGADTLTVEDRRRSGARIASQHLSNPPAQNPTAKPEVRRWIGSRVRADSALCAAAEQRVEQRVEQGGLGPDEVREPHTGGITIVLTRQHNQLSKLSKQLKTIPGHSNGGSANQIEQRGRLACAIIDLLRRHVAAENDHLWPAVRQALPDGDSWADGAAQQQRRGSETLTELSNQSPDSAEFDQLVGKLLPQLHQHVAYQDRLFLQLRPAMPDEQLDALGQAVRDAVPSDEDH